MGSSDGSSIPLLIVFCICLVCSAYFSATESAFSLVNRIRAKTKADEGDKRAKRVTYIVNHFEKALTTSLVGNNVVNTALASVATVLATMWFSGVTDTSSFSFTIWCTLITTAIVSLFCEIIPKSFANDRSETWAYASSGILRFLMRILTPITAVFGLISSGVSRLFAGKEQAPSITEDELAEIIETAEEEGVVDEEQSDILMSALEFSETVVSDVMTMAKDVKALDVSATTEEILSFIRDTVHSRVPVCSGSPDNIIGTLRIRRFLTEYRANPRVRLRSMLSAPYFVREDAKIDDILTDMRQHKHHIAIVVDENKKMVGLATIEDFLEELVGEIFDEEDIVDQNFQSLGGNRYLVNTHMLLGNAYERMGIAPAPRTVAAKPILSFMLESLGHLPAEEESFLFGNLEFTAETVEDDRVVEVVIHILDEEDLAERLAEREEVSE